MIGSWCVLLACIANFGPFVDVTTEIGVVGPEPANSALFIDYDEDGDLDLFIASGSYASSKLYENLGAGYFMDVTWRSGLDVEPGIISAHQGALGTESWADLLVVEALPDEPPAVYKIGEDRVFTRVRPGLEAGRTTTGLLLGDFDSDGFLDLYQMNSALFGEGTDIVYRNLGDGSMENVTARTGLADVADTRGACSGAPALEVLTVTATSTWALSPFSDSRPAAAISPADFDFACLTTSTNGCERWEKSS